MGMLKAIIFLFPEPVPFAFPSKKGRLVSIENNNCACVGQLATLLHRRTVGIKLIIFILILSILITRKLGDCPMLVGTRLYYLQLRVFWTGKPRRNRIGELPVG